LIPAKIEFVDSADFEAGSLRARCAVPRNPRARNGRRGSHV